MKALVVFYSRTKTTGIVAQGIISELNADYEEIIDIKSRGGIFGYLNSGREATTKKIPEIAKIQKDPSNYDIVIIGTPVWSGTMASPVRAYLEKMKGKLNKIALFSTQKGENDRNAFSDMEKLIGKMPVANMSISAKEVRNEDISKIVKDFTNKL